MNCSSAISWERWRGNVITHFRFSPSRLSPACRQAGWPEKSELFRSCLPAGWLHSSRMAQDTESFALFLPFVFLPFVCTVLAPKDGGDGATDDEPDDETSDEPMRLPCRFPEEHGREYITAGVPDTPAGGRGRGPPPFLVSPPFAPPYRQRCRGRYYSDGCRPMHYLQNRYGRRPLFLWGIL